jgi:hypothetical protein
MAEQAPPSSAGRSWGIARHLASDSQVSVPMLAPAGVEGSVLGMVAYFLIRVFRSSLNSRILSSYSNRGTPVPPLASLCSTIF